MNDNEFKKCRCNDKVIRSKDIALELGVSLKTFYNKKSNGEYPNCLFIQEKKKKSAIRAYKSDIINFNKKLLAANQ